MSNKCLVNKLGSVVNNNNLPFYGAFCFNINAQDISEDERKLTFWPAYYNFKVVGSGTVNGVTEGTSSSQTVLLSNGTYKVYIFRKYDATVVSTQFGSSYFCKGAYFDISQLEYSENLADIRLSSPFTTGKLRELRCKTSLTMFLGRWPSGYNASTMMTDYVVDLNALAGCVNLIEFANRSTVTEGNISALATCIKLTTIDIYRDIITGSVESLLDGMVENGRTSGILQIFAGGRTDSGVTWKGKILNEVNYNTNIMNVTFNASGYTTNLDD